MARYQRPLLVLISATAALAGPLHAQTAVPAGSGAPAASPAPRFAAPVLVMAGEKPMGAKRLYPSPVLEDMNGDGRADLVLGDLWGRITVALRLEGDGPARFGPDEPLLARDGKQLDFQNW
jgi:hypothetical protein